MSFYTSLHYYFPRTPPVVVVDDLAKVVGALRAINLVEPDGTFVGRLRFGDRIDTYCPEVDGEDESADADDGGASGAVVSTCDQPDWEHETERFSSLDDLQRAFAGDRRRVRRAYVRLGSLTNEVLGALAHQEGARGFTPGQLELEVGPVKCRRYDGEAFRVGWLSLTLSGYGLPYPWTFRQVRERLEARPEIAALMKVCQTTWPASHELPTEEIVKLRQEVGDLWPYEDCRRPYDWTWGIDEG